ncbi:hypothetical protein ONZ45_g15794 [Pleurotus djamor]|nr:hypothetical protein ONZ45_g15794 [Pleurotus djamor]
MLVEAGSSRVQISSLKTERTKLQVQYRTSKGKARKRSLEPDEGGPSLRKDETKDPEARRKLGDDLHDVQQEEAEVAQIFASGTDNIDSESDSLEEEGDWEGTIFEEAEDDEDEAKENGAGDLGSMIKAAKQRLQPPTVLIVLLGLGLLLALQHANTNLAPSAVSRDVQIVLEGLNDLRDDYESSFRMMEQALSTVEKHLLVLDQQGDAVVRLNNVLPFLSRVTAVIEARVGFLETEVFILRNHFVATDARTTNLERRAGNAAYEERPGYVEYQALWEWMRQQHYFWRIDQHPDLALLSAGAQVDAAMTTSALMMRIPVPSFYGVSIRHIFGNPPETVLSPVATNGDCWAFAGSQGQIAIRMARIARVRSIVVEHVPKSQAFDLTTAPKDIEANLPRGFREAGYGLAREDGILSLRHLRASHSSALSPFR